MTSLTSAGASIGSLLAATMMDRIGRKKTLLLLAVPMILNPSPPFYHYFSRFFLGLGVECFYSLVPTYVTEDTNRGIFGCMMGIVCTTGTLICYTPGPLLTVKTLCLVLVIPPVASVIAFDFSPTKVHTFCWWWRKNNKHE
jgi:MFS family permease